MDHDVTDRSVEKTLKALLKIIHKLTFIKKVFRIFQYHDEPKFFQYSAETFIDPSETDGYTRDAWKAGGSSMFSEKSAFLKCLAEAIERYACMVYHQSELIKSSYHDMSKKAVDPACFSKFTPHQKTQTKYQRFNFDHNTPFTWIKAKSLINNEETYIPAQLIFHNYKLSFPAEKYIDLPISTGAAFGGSLNSALIRGFFELVERDAFSIMYQNQIRCPKVDLNEINDPRVNYLIDLARRYRLEVNLMDITTDLGIPSFASVIINRTGIGPAVQTGIKSHLDPIEAIVGAFQESLHTRCWIRFTYENHLDDYLGLKPNAINTFEKRGIYWYEKRMIKHLGFWLNQPPTLLAHKTETISLDDKKSLSRIKSILKSKHYDAYYLDLTLPQIIDTGCKVVKVISPQLEPHVFNEKFKLLGGKRLHEVPEILGYQKSPTFNNYPHPFL